METLTHCGWEWKMAQLLWKTVWRLLKTVNTELPYDPEFPFLGLYTKELKARTKRYLDIHVCSGIVHNSPGVETTQVSIDR